MSLETNSRDGADILFGVPDTGVQVTWDFSAGCGLNTNERKGTHLKPITPKQTKNPSCSRTFRRRCLSDQIKLPADGDDAFAAQMLSLVTLNRKNILKNSPGVSPKGRSPRVLRSSMNKASPRRDDNFMFLLNDSIENEAMIQCSQITEAFVGRAEAKTPNNSKREDKISSVKRLTIKNLASPLSRKRLLDSCSPKSRKMKSPLRPISLQNNAALKIDAGTNKTTDQCNNNVRASFADEDDDFFMNLPVDCSKIDLPKKSPRLSLNQNGPGIPQSLGVTPIGSSQRKSCRNTSAACSTEVAETEKKIDVIDEVPEDLDDMDFELELSPHILELLDGNVKGDKKQTTPKEEVTASQNKGTLPKQSSPSTSNSTFKSTPPSDGKLNAAPSKLFVPKQPLALKLSQSSQPTSTETSKCASKPILNFKLSQNSEAKPKLTNQTPVKQFSGPNLNQASQQGVKSNSPPSNNFVKKQSLSTNLSQTDTNIRQTSEPFTKNMISNVSNSISSETKCLSSQPRSKASSFSFNPKQPVAAILSQSVQPQAKPNVLSSKSFPKHSSSPLLQTSQTVQSSSKLNPTPVENKVRLCTPAEIERKRQEALKKLKRSHTK